jgi:hypothetical protein
VEGDGGGRRWRWKEMAVEGDGGAMRRVPSEIVSPSVQVHRSRGKEREKGSEFKKSHFTKAQSRSPSLFSTFSAFPCCPRLPASHSP